MKAIFVTGTDTGVGKTVMTGLFAGYLSDKGYRVVTQKWIQTGTRGFSPDIATHLKLARKKRLNISDYLSHVAPYTFKFGSSPHLAARLENRKISSAGIKRSFRLLSRKFDFVIVEGTGGMLVPLSRKKLIIDIARELHLPLLIVAENRLGCINHTLLSVEAARSRHMKILGVIFNSCKKREKGIILKDNPRVIEGLAGEKALGSLGYLKDKNALYKAFTPIADKIFAQLK